MANPDDSRIDLYNPVTNEEKRKGMPLTLEILPELLRGHRMSDAVAILGSIGIILGCVDR
ncbi:hypothetical protein KDH_36200 [Dictyobacter sp. S3.2.2.5]|uniref:NADH-quinone oxidoreductase subunit D domain-containing protein n=1 Tax=Dictyobacter halimunensis TaxID=3026934 RepID=A0ABQ6FR93_9CHLR|nr:hypothetical protein KDH_36200 [Dictyobacter sp. S3.2.2.5]